MRALAIVLFAGCGLIQTTGGGSSTMPGNGGGGGAGPAPTGGGQPFEGMLVRDQLVPLRGMTVEAGRAELARLGYHGQIQIDHPFGFIDECALDTICGIEPESGISLTDPTAVMHFTVNQDKVKISTPDN